VRTSRDPFLPRDAMLYTI